MKRILDLKNRVMLYALYMFCILLPISQKLSTFFIIIWVILSLIYLEPKRIIKIKELWLLPILYLIYIGSLFYSSSFSFKFFEQKAALIVFPFIFFINSFRYTKAIVNRALFVFVIGCLISVIYCYVFAFYNSISFTGKELIFKPQINSKLSFIESSVKGGNYFFGTRFSIVHQTVYYSMYLCFAISILLFENKIFKLRRIKILLISLFSLVVLQVSSKAGIAVLVLIYMYYIYKKVDVKTFVIITIVGVFIAIPLLLFNSRVKIMFNELITKGLTFHNEDINSTSLRLMTWSSSLQIIQKHPLLGVGIGDAYNELKKEYKKERYVTPYRESLNAHNQYFQFLIECGVLALICYIMQLVVLYKNNMLNKQINELIFAFIIIISINSFFESIMNRYSGIAFYSFVLCLFLTSKNKHFQPNVDIA